MEGRAQTGLGDMNAVDHPQASAGALGAACDGREPVLTRKANDPRVRTMAAIRHLPASAHTLDSARQARERWNTTVRLFAGIA